MDSVLSLLGFRICHLIVYTCAGPSPRRLCVVLSVSDVWCVQLLPGLPVLKMYRLPWYLLSRISRFSFCDIYQIDQGYSVIWLHHGVWKCILHLLPGGEII